MGRRRRGEAGEGQGEGISDGVWIYVDELRSGGRGKRVNNEFGMEIVMH